MQKIFEYVLLLNRLSGERLILQGSIFPVELSMTAFYRRLFLLIANRYRLEFLYPLLTAYTWLVENFSRDISLLIKHLRHVGSRRSLYL